MNNTFLKIIAAVLLVGALVVAYLGIQLSRNPVKAPATTNATVAAPTEIVIVASRAISAGQRIEAEDVSSKTMANAPRTAIRQAADVLGKVALNQIAAGTPLSAQQFAIESMASLLRESERAVAVNVDEVIGVGGYAQPGDRVDVLLFLAQANAADSAASAQVVIQNARLLSMGDANQMDAYRERQEAEKESNGTSPASSNEPAKRQKQNLRSAVLAVATSDVTRLMLASSSGNLRLALRPPQHSPKADPLGIQQTSASATDHQVVKLTDLGQGGGATKNTQGTQRPPIIIQEGSTERRLTQNEVGQ
jgi:pilus assembly protein CpaB